MTTTTNQEMIEEMEYRLDRYYTNKILSGHGLYDDPEWVNEFESVIAGREY